MAYKESPKEGRSRERRQAFLAQYLEENNIEDRNAHFAKQAEENSQRLVAAEQERIRQNSVPKWHKPVATDNVDWTFLDGLTTDEANQAMEDFAEDNGYPDAGMLFADRGPGNFSNEKRPPDPRKSRRQLEKRIFSGSNGDRSKSLIELLQKLNGD